MTTITSKAFALRLTKACDESPSVPAYGKGRQVVLANRMKVSQEAVRKWFEGESVPKPQKMKPLAEFLGVDHAWLALGISSEVTKEDIQRANRRSSGSVYVVTGLIMLEGGNCAWPSPTDPRHDYVDIYAIMRGVQTAIHVSTATPLGDGRFEFSVPNKFDDVRCVGLIPQGPGKYHLIDLSMGLIRKHKVRKAGAFSVTMTWVNNQYVTGADEWPRFKTFGEIL